MNVAVLTIRNAAAMRVFLLALISRQIWFRPILPVKTIRGQPAIVHYYAQTHVIAQPDQWVSLRGQAGFLRISRCRMRLQGENRFLAKSDDGGYPVN